MQILRPTHVFFVIYRMTGPQKSNLTSEVNFLQIVGIENFRVNWHKPWKIYHFWVVVSNIYYVHPYLGKWSNLTNIFQMGWNHHLDFDGIYQEKWWMFQGG